jgi:hypothetical protein
MSLRPRENLRGYRHTSLNPLNRCVQRSRTHLFLTTSFTQLCTTQQNISIPHDILHTVVYNTAVHIYSSRHPSHICVQRSKRYLYLLTDYTKHKIKMRIGFSLSIQNIKNFLLFFVVLHYSNHLHQVEEMNVTHNYFVFTFQLFATVALLLIQFVQIRLQ